MGATSVSLEISFVHTCDCTTCGVPIVVTWSRDRVLRETGGQFFCFNGHSNRFGETDKQRLEKQLAAKDAELQAKQRSVDAAKARAKVAENAAAAHKGKVTEIKNRVGNGVCPCCNRSFTNLRRHMQSKHPELKDGKE